MKKWFCGLVLIGLTGVAHAQLYSPVLADTIYRFKDTRDGEKYTAIELGDIAWMGENLRFKTDDSWCYDSKELGCKKFGRLYSWVEATVACPPGWRLPTMEDWQKLLEITGGEKKAGYALVYDTGLGLNMQFGFPPNVNGRFGVEGSQTNFWTATEYNDETAYTYFMIRDKLPLVLYSYLSKKYNLSCRCVKDLEE